MPVFKTGLAKVARKVRADFKAIQIAIHHPYRLQQGDDVSRYEIAAAIAPHRPDVGAVLDSHETVLTANDRLRFERQATR